MSTITTTLPGINTTLFCASQGIATGGFAIFNGTSAGNGAVYLDGQYFRSLSFTSTDDLSGVTIVINGNSNGALVTETITGPNNNTVYSTKCYQSVFQIQVTVGTATNLSVGSGNQAVIPYTFGTRVATAFSCVQDSFGAYISNADAVNIDISGTYRNQYPIEILAELASTQSGVFTIHSSITTGYQLTSAETRGLNTIFFVITSTGATPIILDIFTA